MKKPTTKKADSNMLFWLFVALTFMALSFGTRLHDPVLHGAWAWASGWQVSDWEAGLTTGSTSAILGAKGVSTWRIWGFYMFPSIAIFVGAFIINIIKPNRFIRVIGLVVMALNLASFDPGNIGSDAQKATALLTERGWSEMQAYGLHYIIAITFITLYTLYLYIVIENSNRDASNRFRRLI